MMIGGCAEERGTRMSGGEAGGWMSVVLLVLAGIAALIMVWVGIWLFQRRRAFRDTDGPTKAARGSSGAREYENSQGNRPFIDGSGGPDTWWP
jgi:uncharacterized iron-regulated membrane protein